MSILLDSLRKSEAQRNAGGTPTIYSTQGYGDSGNSHRRWIVWLLLALSATVIVWFGWRQYSPPDLAGNPAQEIPENSSVTATGDPAGEKQVSDAGIAPATRTPVEQIAEASDSTSGELSPNASEDIGTAAEKVAQFVAEEQARIMQSDGQSDGQSIDEMSETSDGSVAFDEGPVFDDEQANDVISGEDRPADRPRRSRLSEIDPPEDEPLSYWQLAQGLRNELPEFKITVLVYAEAPEDRFILMNGERLREQDETESGVTLEEIRRDGAIFSYQSRRFLVRN